MQRQKPLTFLTAAGQVPESFLKRTSHIKEVEQVCEYVSGRMEEGLHAYPGTTATEKKERAKALSLLYNEAAFCELQADTCVTYQNFCRFREMADTIKRYILWIEVGDRYYKYLECWTA